METKQSPINHNGNINNNSIKKFQAFGLELTLEEVKQVLNLAWKISNTVKKAISTKNA